LPGENHPGGSWMRFPDVDGTVELAHRKCEHGEVVEEDLRDEIFHLENVLEMLFVPLNVYLIEAGETIHLNPKNYTSLQNLVVPAFANDG